MPKLWQERPKHRLIIIQFKRAAPVERLFLRN
jgi:hypothetical protein